MNNNSKKYQIIYADPPWTYRDKGKSGKRGVEYKYQCMGIEDIKNLRVSEISCDDSILFLWVTFPLLQEGLDVINAWGFTYKTIGFNWVKRNKKSNSWFWGMGNWTRASSEICLLATKGKPKRVSASVHSIIDTPIEGHSKKPNVVRDKIIELCGDVPRVELFAREKVEGWDCIGFDIDGKDIVDVLSNETKL